MASEASAQEPSGVGIALGKEGEEIVVKAVLTEGPAAASHAVHVGDQIIAVAQGDGADVRVKGWEIGDVVRRIRGPKGTSVRLTIVPARKDDTQAYVISLVRGELKELAGWGDGALLKGGTRASNIEFISLEGQPPEQLAEYAGKVVVLEFWSISCGPCQAKMAELQSLPEKHPEWKGKVALIAVDSVDEDRSAVIKHLKERGWDKTHNVTAGAEAMKAYHVNTLPTVYVIDPRGVVIDASHVLDIPAIVNRLLEAK
jgi:thiol-disulfide isomerase/thioredoxin